MAEAAEAGLAEGGAGGLERAVLKAREDLYVERGYEPYALAESLASIDPERAFTLLASLERTGDPYIMAARCDPLLGSLRRDRRFTALLRRLGLPPLPAVA